MLRACCSGVRPPRAKITAPLPSPAAVLPTRVVRREPYQSRDSKTPGLVPSVQIQLVQLGRVFRVPSRHDVKITNISSRSKGISRPIHLPRNSVSPYGAVLSWTPVERYIVVCQHQFHAAGHICQSVGWCIQRWFQALACLHSGYYGGVVDVTSSFLCSGSLPSSVYLCGINTWHETCMMPSLLFRGASPLG